MRTAVFQPFCTNDVPQWLQDCLDSVRGWAGSRGYEYRFYDDAFFDRCPEWFRAKAQKNILLMSDLARLVAARELLDEGFDRAVWVDADLIVFSPSTFDVKFDGGFALCRELWINMVQGKFVGWARVNNAVCGFDRGNAFLDFYIDAAEKIVRHGMQKVDPWAIGTKFLSELAKLVPLPLIGGVGTLNPILMDRLAQGDVRLLREYRKAYGQPIAAANLCGSFRENRVQGVLMSDAVYQGSISQLLGPAGSEISGGV